MVQSLEKINAIARKQAELESLINELKNIINELQSENKADTYIENELEAAENWELYKNYMTIGQK
uniref:Uncharacterized protein n=1 Tax=Dulem virus 42 TaxID=3145760 RepID=A0AAU8B7U3_9CAUD